VEAGALSPQPFAPGHTAVVRCAFLTRSLGTCSLPPGSAPPVSVRSPCPLPAVLGVSCFLAVAPPSPCTSLNRSPCPPADLPAPPPCLCALLAPLHPGAPRAGPFLPNAPLDLSCCLAAAPAARAAPRARSGSALLLGLSFTPTMAPLCARGGKKGTDKGVERGW